MGRPPKTTSELKLTGTWRADRHGDRADVTPQGRPVKPDDLDADAADLWDAIIDGCLARGADSADAPALSSMCRWWSVYIRCDRKMAGDDPNYKAGVLASMAYKQFSQMAAKFGLTPVDRAKLKMDPGALQDERALALPARKRR